MFKRLKCRLIPRCSFENNESQIKYEEWFEVRILHGGKRQISNGVEPRDLRSVKAYVWLPTFQIYYSYAFTRVKRFYVRTVVRFCQWSIDTKLDGNSIVALRILYDAPALMAHTTMPSAESQLMPSFLTQSSRKLAISKGALKGAPDLSPTLCSHTVACRFFNVSIKKRKKRKNFRLLFESQCKRSTEISLA